MMRIRMKGRQRVATQHEGWRGRAGRGDDDGEYVRAYVRACVRE